MGISKKTVIISLTTIAAGASLASAQRDLNTLNTFALDLQNSTAVVAEQAFVPFTGLSSNQTLDLSGITSTGNTMFPAGIQFLVPASGPQEGGFSPNVNTITHNQYGSTDGPYLDTVTKPDILYIVPLPPAAFAGLGLICGIAGVRKLKSHK